MLFTQFGIIPSTVITTSQAIPSVLGAKVFEYGCITTMNSPNSTDCNLMDYGCLFIYQIVN